MTLLALLNLAPNQPWAVAGAPLMGITPIMNFIRDSYGVDYAPNTRETIRRQTVHQFVQAALVIENPDAPDKPKNSSSWRYQIEPAAFNLLRSYGSAKWDANLAEYLQRVTTLQERYARQRALNLVPVQVASGQEITLSPGGHSHLLKQVIEAFAARFVPGGKLIYVGDTAQKWGYFDETLATSQYFGAVAGLLTEPPAGTVGDRPEPPQVIEKIQTLLHTLGISIDLHGKMPDVVIYDHEREWLLLIEAVTSHGPVNPKRRIELQKLFAPLHDRLVFVTAFLTMQDMARHVVDISWATEVWVADNPTHLIHFDGVRFLGPCGRE